MTWNVLAKTFKDKIYLTSFRAIVLRIITQKNAWNELIEVIGSKGLNVLYFFNGSRF